MENKKPVSHIAAGLIISGVLIIFSVIVSLFIGASASPGNGLLNYLVIIVGLAIFINLYGRANQYRVKFSDLFSYGFKATAIIVLVFVAFLIILFLFVPGLKDSALEATRTQMQKNKALSPDDVDKSVGLLNRNFWAFAIGSTVLAFVVTGAIGSLIGAALTKKLPPAPPSTTTDQLYP